MNELQITYHPPAALSPHSRNARLHSPKQIDQLAASIRSFGFNSPVLIDCNCQILAAMAGYLPRFRSACPRSPPSRSNI